MIVTGMAIVVQILTILTRIVPSFALSHGIEVECGNGPVMVLLFKGVKDGRCRIGRGDGDGRGLGPILFLLLI